MTIELLSISLHSHSEPNRAANMAVSESVGPHDIAHAEGIACIHSFMLISITYCCGVSQLDLSSVLAVHALVFKTG